MTVVCDGFCRSLPSCTRIVDVTPSGFFSNLASTAGYGGLLQLTLNDAAGFGSRWRAQSTSSWKVLLGTGQSSINSLLNSPYAFVAFGAGAAAGRAVAVVARG